MVVPEESCPPGKGDELPEIQFAPTDEGTPSSAATEAVAGEVDFVSTLPTASVDAYF